MRNDIDGKAREELDVLHKLAESHALEASKQLAAGVYEHKGTQYQRNAETATALALLAIDARLAMATSFILWALESDDG